MADAIQKMREDQGQLVKRARAIQDAADRENRSLTAEQEAEFDKIMAEADGLAAKVERAEKLAKAEARMAAPISSPESRAYRNQPVEMEADGYTPRGAYTERENTRASAERRSAIQHYFTGGVDAMSDVERRALTVSTSVSGGYLLPQEEFVNQLLTEVTVLAPFRSVANVIPLTNAVSLGVPSLSISDDDDEWCSEVQTAPKDTSTSTGKRSLTPHPQRKQIEVSNQILLQSGNLVENYVRGLLAAKLARAQEKAFLTGDGNNKPLGVFTASSQGVDTSRDVNDGNTATVLSGDAFVGAKYALKGPYQSAPTTRWILHRNVLKAVRKLKTSGSGEYLWQPSLAAGEPETILGVGVMQSEYAPYTQTASQYVGAIGDLKQYWIAESLAIAIKRLNEIRALDGMTVFLAEALLDGMPMQAEAFARIQMAAS